MNSKGFSLIEALIGVILLAIVGMLGASIIHSQVKTTQSSIDRLTEEADAHSAVRDLTKELQESHIMRLGKANCGAFGSILSTIQYNVPSQTIQLTKAAPQLSFVTSSYAGFAARNLTTAGDLFVTDVNRFPVGSLIALINSFDSNYSGYYLVKANDTVRSLISIMPADLALSKTACKSAGVSYSVTDILDSGKLSNQTFVVHRAHVLNYKVKPDGLYRARWPEDSTQSEDPKIRVVNNFIDLSIKSSWFTYEPGNVARSGLHGRWQGDLQLTADFKDASDGSRLSRNKLVTQASYDLPSAERENKKVSTDAPTLKMVFPTCSISFSQVSGMIKVPDDPAFANTLQYLLTGSASEDVIGSITTSLTPGVGAKVFCYKVSSLPADRSVSGYGSSASLTLNREASGYESYVCAISGAINAAASMSYADASQGRTITTACTGFKVESPTGFKHSNGQAAKCTKNGVIDFGDPLVEDVISNPKAGPALYTGPTSCFWSDSPSNLGESCDNSNRAEGSELLNVILLPGGTKINGGALALVCE